MSVILEGFPGPIRKEAFLSNEVTKVFEHKTGCHLNQLDSSGGNPGVEINRGK